jgi:hypothetical protein
MPACRASVRAIGAWQIAHFCSMTSRNAGVRATSALTLACHSGSRALCAIIVERQWASNDTSWPAASRRLLWHVAHTPEPEKSAVVNVDNGQPG